LAVFVGPVFGLPVIGFLPWAAGLGLLFAFFACWAIGAPILTHLMRCPIH